MKAGNWVPLSKAFVQYLPKDRAYTKIEAALSLQITYDNDQPATIAGFAAMWSWSRKKVRLFFDKIGVELTYPKDTKKLRNQKGHIRVHKRDISSEKKRHIRFIDSKWLGEERDIKEENKEHKRDIKGNSNNDPNPDPNTLDNEFDKFWDTYGKKTDKKKCFEKFKKLNPESKILISKTLADYVKSTPDKQYRKNPLTYLNGECWKDEVENYLNQGVTPQKKRIATTL